MGSFPFFVSMLAAGAALVGPVPASAATTAAADCTQPAVQSAVDGAVSGDTVTVPAGTCTWSAPVRIRDKTITFRGAGSGAGGTKIVHGGGNHGLVEVDAGSQTGRMDISGFWFQGEANNWDGTAMRLWGPTGWKNLRVHDNVFDGNHPWTIKGGANTHGLIDHNVFRGKAHGILLYGLGAQDWQTPLKLGTADFFFIENNVFDWDDFFGNTGVGSLDMFDGGRVVFRYNTLTNGFWLTHDKARSGLVSANAYEVYGNVFRTRTNKWKGVDATAGTGVIWGNDFVGDWRFPIGVMDYKTSDPRDLPRCDGNDPADQNVPGESGWRCQYQIGSQGEGASARSFPLYVWGNRENGVLTPMQCTDDCSHLREGRDYVNNGMTPKPGYTPYVFPHPLSHGALPALQPPTDVRAEDPAASGSTRDPAGGSRAWREWWRP